MINKGYVDKTKEVQKGYDAEYDIISKEVLSKLKERRRILTKEYGKDSNVVQKVTEMIDYLRMYRAINNTTGLKVPLICTKSEKQYDIEIISPNEWYIGVCDKNMENMNISVFKNYKEKTHPYKYKLY